MCETRQRKSLNTPRWPISLEPNSGKARKRQGKQKTQRASILPMVVHGTARRGRYEGAMLRATDKDQD